MSRRRRRTLIVVALPAVIGIYLLVTLVHVWQAGHRDGARATQAIVVLGAAQYDGKPSPALQARLDHVVELWDAGLAGTVVVTGGKQPGDRFTEATASATYLRGKGVPEGAILREVNGRSTWQSLNDAAAILKKRGITDVVLVSDPYHAARVEGMASELGLTASVSPTRTSPESRGSVLARYGQETLVVGAARIVGFRRLVGVLSRVQTAVVTL